MNYNQKLIALAAGFVLVAGGSFYAGMQVQQSLKPASAQSGGSATTNGGGSRGGYGGRFGANGQRPTFGTVNSITGTTMVVTSRSGANINISLTGNPTVVDSSGSDVASSTIKTGDTVIVLGTAESDGTINATQIRLNPTLGGPTSGSGSGSVAQ